MERINPRRSTTEATRNELALEQARLSRRLAEVSARLERLEDSSEHAPPRMILTSHWNEWRDEGYIGGFESSSNFQPCTLEITTYDLSLAYLAMLAMQPHPIPDTHKEIGQFEDHLHIYIKKVELADGTTVQPSNEVSEYFETLRTETADLVATLRESVRNENPFKDVPTNISTTSLGDALLRKALLDYCHRQDAHFVLSDTPVNIA